MHLSRAARSMRTRGGLGRVPDGELSLVYCSSDEENDFTGVGSDGPSFGMKLSHGPIGADKAVVDFVRSLLSRNSGEGVADRLAIFGMDAFEEGRGVEFALFWLDS